MRPQAAEDQAAVGNAVGFVLWFNFLAGFAYMLASVGLFLQHRPAVWISLGIPTSTALVGIVFGVHMLQGGAFESRIVGAMFLRKKVWAVISVVAFRYIATPAATNDVK
ncbi:MAG: hypothetical protein U0934_13805 [Pseudotabrizicola sp.]|uniref:hypothetical protein n=1 Tax=Pseudotabrizicola sp. TaxID=2939647 RepID=UPI002730508C|nr:hypothetical protein [Pseudotabrizicola sp.]MDZ7575012.1 hypothetical protein [Pseudotabrizicola sp.]